MLKIQSLLNTRLIRQDKWIKEWRQPSFHTLKSVYFPFYWIDQIYRRLMDENRNNILKISTDWKPQPLTTLIEKIYKKVTPSTKTESMPSEEEEILNGHFLYCVTSEYALKGIEILNWHVLLCVTWCPSMCVLSDDKGGVLCDISSNSWKTRGRERNGHSQHPTV